MKHLSFAFFTIALLIACNTADNKTDDAKEDDSKIASEGKPTAKEWVPVDSATAMRTMMEVATPGPQHTLLAKSNGEWVGETTMWMAPDAPPVKATSTAVNKMIMGGRYQQTTFKGNFMGQPFEGTSITGYDNAKKLFTNTWIDNMSTGTMYMEGPWDEATKTMTLKGRMINPANGIECEMREVYKLIDDNTQIMEMYGPDMKTGKEYKNMEIKFTRKK